MTSRIIQADCRDAMREMDANSVDAIVCDPPYHLTTGKRGGSGAASDNPNSPAGRARVTTGFMGKAWDGGGIAFDPATWADALRVAKPGAHLLAFGGTRTYHRLACAIEDAGFEIRDCVMWVYGSGFPKSLDVSKAIDKAAGIAREDKFEGAFDRRAGPTGNKLCDACGKWLVSGSPCQCPRPQDAGVTDAARQWQGWGTALKPAWEPIIVARKPLRGTVAANVQQFGTGALNIDGCRIETDESITNHSRGSASAISKGIYGDSAAQETHQTIGQALGRWPANVIHDGSDEVVALFPETTSGDLSADQQVNGGYAGKNASCYGTAKRGGLGEYAANAGSAARFFYTAKASASDRNEGLHHRSSRKVHGPSADGRCWDIPGSKSTPRANHHPTVKPVDLMRYLCRLVTPPSGTVLDPFCGSGSTGKAALLEGFDFIGIELDEEYVAIARERIYAAAPLFAGEVA